MLNKRIRDRDGLVGRSGRPLPIDPATPVASSRPCNALHIDSAVGSFLQDLGSVDNWAMGHDCSSSDLPTAAWLGDSSSLPS